MNKSKNAELKERFDDFLHMVSQLRWLQKEYFKTRRQETLRECKKWEQKVDRAIADHEAGFQSLFED